MIDFEVYVIPIDIQGHVFDRYHSKYLLRNANRFMRYVD